MIFSRTERRLKLAVEDSLVLAKERCLSEVIEEGRRMAELAMMLADAIETRSAAADSKLVEEDYSRHCLRELRIVRLVLKGAIGEAGIDDEVLDRYVVKWFPLATKTMH